MAVLLYLTPLFAISFSSAAEIDAAIWNPPRAYLCPTDKGLTFPSKYSATNPSHCDDGDMTLFNGLLCASGEQLGCDAVRQSQGDGRWWRSPRKIGQEASPNDSDDPSASFSPDQALGVLLYALHTRDTPRFEKWLSWIETNRPCIIEFAGQCRVTGLPRFCTDDFKNKACTLRLDDCAFIGLVASSLGLQFSVCEDILRGAGHLIGIPSLDRYLLLPADVFGLGAAVLNKPDYPLHLAAVKVVILRVVGGNSLAQSSAEILVARQEENPFFNYLLHGKNGNAGTLTAEYCPHADDPLTARSQWAWERPIIKGEKGDWKDSMYWDCIFMANLLNGPDLFH